MSTIVDPYGAPLTRQAETTVSLRAVAMLAELEDIMRQEGIGLRCIKCEASGLHGAEAGIRGDNVQGSDTFRLVCACCVRVHSQKTGKVKVIL